jgi:hypothetical protein
MANQGFSYVTDDGFIGFLTELSKEAWGAIDIRDLLGEAPKSSWRASCEARWKLRLVTSCEALSATKKALSRTPKEIDDEVWDPLQRTLDTETAVFLNRDDEAKKKAAQDVRAEFVIGAGRGQTRLSHDKEVDHGRKQVTLAKEQFKNQIALLELGPLIAKIDDATELLADALGIGSSTLNTSANRQRLKRGSISDCILAFGGVLNDIEWQLSRQNAAEETKLLMALQTPLLALLERYAEKPEPKKDPTKP